MDYIPQSYVYEEHWVNRHAAQLLHINEHRIIKTIVVEDDSQNPMLILMHGDKEVSTREMTPCLGLKTARLCEKEKAEKYTDYQGGGISPFSIRRKLLVFVEKSILDLDYIFLNGGKRGFFVKLNPAILIPILSAREITVAI